ncbi:MAG: polyprenyl synthetase family protein [Candidatus Moranbacteria bacterium]|nr:polyprenyl synthetase family protein [Candidatus Moranbacteria bacterium]
MDARKTLVGFKEKIDPYLERYFQKKIQEAGKIDIIAEETLHLIRDYTMAGGKRIRPAFLYFGYLAAGGKDKRKAMEISIAVELLHSFLLIHDDIIDRDPSRHGVETIHERFKAIGKKYDLGKDHMHFGNSMAMMAGDMTAAMACEIIFTSKFSAENIIKALDKLQKIVFITVPGEMMDVMMQYAGTATEEAVLKMHECKTARYTFEGPLHLGGILAGGDAKLLKHFSDYALPLGKAFQIQDDILGIFGEEEKIGKPVGSDIIEGKQTVLVIKALELGDARQQAAIGKYLKKTDLKREDLEAFRQIVRETGSLEYSQKLAAKFIREALAALRKIEFKDKGAREFLFGIAEYMLDREM